MKLEIYEPATTPEQVVRLRLMPLQDSRLTLEEAEGGETDQ